MSRFLGKYSVITDLRKDGTQACVCTCKCLLVYTYECNYARDFFFFVFFYYLSVQIFFLVYNPIVKRLSFVQFQFVT